MFLLYVRRPYTRQTYQYSLLLGYPSALYPDFC